MWVHFIDARVYLTTNKILMKEGKTMNRECTFWVPGAWGPGPVSQGRGAGRILSPRPSIVLNCKVTHGSFIKGREIHPFGTVT